MSSQLSHDAHFRGQKWLSISSILLAALSVLSWVATYIGVLEFIAASKTELTTALYIVLGAVVALVQTMIVYILHSLFSRRLPIFLRPFLVLLYLLFSIITVGFGFGFFWKLLSASSETLKSAETSVTIVQSALNRNKDRFENLQFTLRELADYSKKSADQEASTGNTCPSGSARGVGPRQRMRNSDSVRFGSARDYVGQRIDRLKAEIDGLEPEFLKIAKNDPSTVDRATGTHIVFMTELNKKLGQTVDNLNDLRKDPQLLEYRDEFAKRSEQTTFPDDRGGTFPCPDQKLKNSINGAVRAINDLPQIEPVKIVITEGSHAVAEAIVRLKNTAFALAINCASLVRVCTLPPSAQEIRDARTARSASGDLSNASNLDEQQAGIGRDDVIPLALAVLLDLGILFVAVIRGTSEQIGTHNSQFIQILNEAFRQAFGRRATDSELLPPINAVVFDHLGGHYAAVPLNYRDPRLARRREEPPAWLDGGGAASNQGKKTAQGEPPPLREIQYIGNAFNAFAHIHFVKVVGFWGRLLVPTWLARWKLARQSEAFANARAYRIYRFYPRAWNDVVWRVLVGGIDGATAYNSPDVAAPGTRSSGSSWQADQPPPLSQPEDQSPSPSYEPESKNEPTRKGTTPKGFDTNVQ